MRGGQKTHLSSKGLYSSRPCPSVRMGQFRALYVTLALCTICLNVVTVDATVLAQQLHLRGGSGHQGSDVNAKDPTGIWSTFERVGANEVGSDKVGSMLRTVANVWGQGSCLRRSQPDITFRLTAPSNVSKAGVTAVCAGSTFCGKVGEEHHFLCQCESAEIPPTEFVFGAGDGELLKCSGRLEPGQYRVTLRSGDGEAEVLQGMHGLEEFRPVTVLPKPPPDAVLLMSDIDGTLIGDNDATDKSALLPSPVPVQASRHSLHGTGAQIFLGMERAVSSAGSASGFASDPRLPPPRARAAACWEAGTPQRGGIRSTTPGGRSRARTR